MQTTPLISFCIPTYNRASYLKRCIESLIGYQGNDIEIIVRDNASPDNTESIAKSFTDPRIKYYRNDTNKGAKYNVCRVLEDAVGEYTFCLTDDDTLIPGTVDRLKEFIATYQPHFFKSDLIVFWEKSRKVTINSFLSKSKYGKELSVIEIANIYHSSHVFSGLCFQTQKKDNAFFNLFKDNYYPSMALTASFGNEVGYLSEPTVLHTWENELFWDLDKEETLYKDSEKIVENLSKVYPEEIIKEICKIHCKQDWWLTRPLINQILSKKEMKTYRKKLPAFVRRWGLSAYNMITTVNK